MIIDRSKEHTILFLFYNLPHKIPQPVVIFCLRIYTEGGNTLMEKKHMATILLIEDQLETTALVKAIMKMQQIDVIAVERAQDGLDLMRENPPDLVLMDLLLPEIDGFAATEIIKNDDSLKHIPVIAITAASIANVHDRLTEVGADAYVAKPFVIPELLDVVRSFLM